MTAVASSKFGSSGWSGWLAGTMLLGVTLMGCGDGARLSQTDGGLTGDVALSQFACPVPLPTSCSNPARKYADIAPIFVSGCATCHSGVAGGPWPLSDYITISEWADLIRSDLSSCSMPPADGGIALSADDRAAILDWIACGYPQ
jgi:Cytochrome C oxidase, cbb3-type, subunit III